MGLIHKMTKIKGSTKLMFSKICKNLFSRQYLKESQCIFAIRKPGKVNNEPKTPQAKAIKNFTTIFEAGPLE